MLIREVMVKPPVVVHQQTPLAEVAEVMLTRQASCVAVVDDQGELSGIITEDDFVPAERGIPFSTERLPNLFGEWMPNEGVERVYEAARGLKAEDIMKPPACELAENTPLEEALVMMQSHRHLPVVRGKVPVGTFSQHEVLMMMK